MENQEDLIMELGLNNKLVVGPSPHIHARDSIPRIMWSVVLALMPALVVAAIYFGWYTLMIVFVSVATALLTEVSCQRLRGIPITISDGSAVVTGLLLAYVIPPNVPIYIPIVGSAFAIGIAKHAFGGLGCNIWNPALAGRAFLLAAYSSSIVMTKWPILKEHLFGNILTEAVTKATPCAVLKNSPFGFFEYYSISDIFIGSIPGSIGETSVLALAIGAAYLIIRGYVNWRLPLAYIGTVMVMVVLLPVSDGHGGMVWLFHGGAAADPGMLFTRAVIHAFSGGLMLGAFFMATDMVTSPLTSRGQVFFGIGCGFLVSVIRLYSGYPEGVCYSILIMNTAVWLIDKLTVPRFFGVKRNEAKAT